MPVSKGSSRRTKDFTTRVRDGLAKNLPLHRAVDRAMEPIKAAAFKRAFRDALSEGLTGEAAIQRGLKASEAPLFKPTGGRNPPLDSGVVVNPGSGKTMTRAEMKRLTGGTEP